MERRYNYEKLAVLDLKDSGRQIGEKLFTLLSAIQKKELAQFVRDYEAGDIPADFPYTTLFRGRYHIRPHPHPPKRAPFLFYKKLSAQRDKKSG